MEEEKKNRARSGTTSAKITSPDAVAHEFKEVEGGIAVATNAERYRVIAEGVK